MTTVAEKIEQFKRQLLHEELSKCTDKQREFFYKLFPGGVPDDNLEMAIDLCMRTVKLNEEKE